MARTLHKSWPLLWKKLDSGAFGYWRILVDDCGSEGAIIVTTWGQEGGAQQQTQEAVKEGKNVGKKNETTPLQQAVKDAGSKWEKQQKAKGYVQTKDAAERGQRDKDFVAGGIDPMLAQRYDKHPAKIKFPCYAQPKLDGIRCIATIKDGRATLWTRTRKQINSVPHIVAALEKCFAGKTITIDGELYNHEYHNDFEVIVSLVRPNAPVAGHEKVEYHIYDMVSGHDFADRNAALTRTVVRFLETNEAGPLKLVRTSLVSDSTRLPTAHAMFTELGYEGTILRNEKGGYEEGKRSYNLQKVKDFVDEEFECIEVKSTPRQVTSSEGTKQVLDVTFVCKLPKGGTFETSMMGSRENVEVYARNPRLVIGKKLTVQFQGYTADGSVRFPKARYYAREDYE